jgi:threonine dehydratase
LPTLAEIKLAETLVHAHMPPTPQYTWPLLNRRLAAECWVKHENHSPVGAFKLRGALVFMQWLKETHSGIETVVAATRGNHGQGVGLAARLHNLRAVIVVPHGNSKEKNQAMLAQGVDLVEHGEDFQESLEFARQLAANPGSAMVESIHPCLVRGTATYAYEFFRGAPKMDTIYVPIGMGSSICGVAAARNALHLDTEIVGVVVAGEPAHAISFREHQVRSAPATTQIADGLACRQPNPQAMQAMWDNVARVVEVTDAQVASAMRALFQDTHNLAEGAAAASLAAAIKERDQNVDKKIGIILTGANVDADLFAKVLAEEI